MEKEKRTNDKSSKEKDKNISKGKRQNIFTMVVQDTLLLIVLFPRILKSLCKLLGVTWILKSTTSEDARQDQNNFLTFVASTDFVHDSDCEYTDKQNAT